MSDIRDLMARRAEQTIAQQGLRQLQQQAAQRQSGTADTTALIPLSLIVIDDAIQVRVAGLDENKVEQYAVIMAEGGDLPPIVVFRDSATDALYLADGFHRVAAAQRAGLHELRAEIRPGGYDGAYEYAEEANLEHGFALSTADKRAIFERRLARGHAWAQMSDREIARLLGVSHPTIANWKSSLTGKNLPVRGNEGKNRVVLTADGRLMKTGRIARANQKRAARKSGREMPAEPVGTFENQEGQTVAERIMAALIAHGDLGPAHLSKVSGLSYAEFNLVMDDLIDDGWVEKRIDRGTGLVTFRALAIPESGNERGVDTVDVQAVRRRIIELLLAAADGFDRIGEKVEAHDLRTWANAFKKEWGV